MFILNMFAPGLDLNMPYYIVFDLSFLVQNA